MTAPRPARARRQARPPSQHGQSSVEYVVVCAVIAVALGIGMTTPDSVLHQLLAAFGSAWRAFSYAISLPDLL